MVHSNVSKQYARRKQIARELLETEKEYFFYLLTITEVISFLQE
jgi:hypothetical protein